MPGWHSGVFGIEADQQQRRVKSHGIGFCGHRGFIRFAMTGNVGDKFESGGFGHVPVDATGYRDLTAVGVDPDVLDTQKTVAEFFDGGRCRRLTLKGSKTEKE